MNHSTSNYDEYNKNNMISLFYTQKAVLEILQGIICCNNVYLIMYLNIIKTQDEIRF